MIKKLFTIIVCGIFFIPTMIWAVIKFIRCKSYDCNLIDGLDRQHRINRAEYFKSKNLQ